MVGSTGKAVFVSIGLVAVLIAGVAFGLYQAASRPAPEAVAAARHRLDQLPPNEREEIRGLAVVDFSRPGWHRRLALYDHSGDLVGTYLVAHARNSGDHVSAISFSNEMDSNQSSLGLYRVLHLYDGEHGPALRLEGLDPGINDRAFERDIVIHGADYVSFGSILENLFSGKGPGVGRSLGCPAVSFAARDEVVQELSDGGYLFIHR